MTVKYDSIANEQTLKITENEKIVGFKAVRYNNDHTAMKNAPRRVKERSIRSAELRIDKIIVFQQLMN